MYIQMGTASAVVASLVLLIALVLFIWTVRGLFMDRKTRSKTSDPAPDAKKETDSKTVDSTAPDGITPSKRLENLSFLVVVSFTISCIVYFPASLRFTHFDVGDWSIGAVYTFWFIGYVMMFMVFFQRLKEIGALSKIHRRLFIVLLCIFGLSFVAYMVAAFAFSSAHTAKSIIMLSGVGSYLCGAVMIMVLFTRRLWQQMKVESDPEMLQNPELLELITRYTVLGFVGIVTSVCVTITWVVYFAFAVHYRTFMDVWTLWILPMDEIVNMICIALYLPFATTTYDRICCLTHSICKNQCRRMMTNQKSDAVDEAQRTQDV